MRMRSKNRLRAGVGAVTALALALAPTGGVLASSHREAPFITENPKVDATDFYMFRSYEAGREDYVTLIANYLPLQDAYGGPNYFTLDPEALYEIHVDNNGDAERGPDLPVPLPATTWPAARASSCRRRRQDGGGAADQHRRRSPPPTPSNLNVARELHASRVVRGDRRTGAVGGRHQRDTDGRQDLQEADRLHRHQDLRPGARATRTTPPPTSTTSTSPAAHARAGCSWASARSPSRSTWARSSTW